MFNKDPIKKTMKVIAKDQKRGIANKSICPRCGLPVLSSNLSQNVFVKDAGVYICSTCGIEHGLSFGHESGESLFEEWAVISGKVAENLSQEKTLVPIPRFDVGDRVFDTACTWNGVINERLSDSLYSIIYDGENADEPEIVKDKELVFYNDEDNEMVMVISSRFSAGNKIQLLSSPSKKNAQHINILGTINRVLGNGSIEVTSEYSETFVINPERDVFAILVPASKQLKPNKENNDTEITLN